MSTVPGSDGGGGLASGAQPGNNFGGNPSAGNGQTGAAGSSSGNIFGQNPAGDNQTFGGGAIVGVASLSKDPTIRTYSKKATYNEWQFIYDPTSNLRNGLPRLTFRFHSAEECWPAAVRMALLLAIHLPRWSSNLRAAESRRLVRTPQQDSFRPANDTAKSKFGAQAGQECSRTRPLPSELGPLRGRRADAENIDLCRPFQTETLPGSFNFSSGDGI